MKKYAFASCLALATLLSGTAVFAQSAKEKDKEKKEKSSNSDEEIIIRKKGDKDSKVTIEIKDGEVTVNGKPIDEYEDENVSVRKRRNARVAVTAPSLFRNGDVLRGGGAWNYNGDAFEPLIATAGNKAFLGVTTDEEDGGAKIMSVTENSAAEKAGLKKGDVITRVNEHAVEDPSDLTKAIGKFKPEDKVTVTYKRDGKENKTSATLGKNKTSVYSYGLSSPQLAPSPRFDFDWDDHGGQYFSIGGRPRLGIRAQDTEEGKGVKVLDVAKESIAEKSGIKEGDIITEFDGKAINSADDLAEAAQESREKAAVKVQLTRDGKSQTIEVKTPKKLKTANL